MISRNGILLQTIGIADAKIDFKVGGGFCWALNRLEAKDGSMRFGFGGRFTSISVDENIELLLSDDRKVGIAFSEMKRRFILFIINFIQVIHRWALASLTEKL